LRKPKKKPTTKARSQRKKVPSLSRPAPKEEPGGRPDAPALAEATTFANRRPSWHDRALVLESVFRFIRLGVEDEAAVDHAIDLLDLIDRKILAREKERAEEIKRFEEEANIPEHLDFRRGAVFITGQQRRERAERNFIEFLRCWNLFVCPIDDIEEEISRSQRGLNEEQVRYLERKKLEGFSREELSGLRAIFKVTAGIRSKAKKHRQILTKVTPTQGGKVPLTSEPAENN
jgi:hypothetical protein